jgi:putative hydrolase of the HAD superfamily
LNAPAAGPAGALLLDALGTLLELEPPAPALREQLRRRGIEVGSGLAERAITAEIAHYRAHLDEGRDAASLDRLRRGCAQVVARELAGGGVEPPRPDEMTEILLASLQFRRFADVQPALRELRHQGLALVVVSNWDVSLPAVLDRLGVAGLLDGILTSAEAGVRKPAPEIFERALAIAGVGAGAAWHVGDSLQEDVAGARAAGISPVLICRGHALAPAGVPVIRSLAELPAVLSPSAD